MKPGLMCNAMGQGQLSIIFMNLCLYEVMSMSSKLHKI